MFSGKGVRLFRKPVKAPLFETIYGSMGITAPFSVM